MQILQFVHVGMQYSVKHGMLDVCQATHTNLVASFDIPKGIRGVDVITGKLQNEHRGLLTSLLYDTQTRIDLVCEITMLQQRNSSTNGINLKQASELLARANLNAEWLGKWLP